MRKHGTFELKTREERFWEYVDKTSGCWLWTGRTNGGGYGLFGYQSQTWRAHRLSYTWANGPIPDGLEIDHKCRVRNCVRPSHLQAVTRGLNRQNLAATNLDSSSGFRGVSWNKRERKWQVYAKHNRKRYQAGYFDSLEDAKAAAVDLRNQLMTNNLTDRNSPAQKKGK